MQNKEIEWLLRDKYDGIETPQFEIDKKRLEEGEPLAYIIGWIPFINCRIYLGSRPLIPRTETEYWVAKTIEDVKRSGVENSKILDLCAGSGCIGVSILKEIQGAEVHFAEIEDGHHETIKINIRENNLDENRVKIFGGNIFENIEDKYDFILSNPPYINPKLVDRVMSNVIAYEPKEALFGGEAGLEIINKIIGKAPKYLNEGGILYIEHEPEQIGTLSTNPRFLRSDYDQFGVIRVSQFRG